jgi:hypothetical protein
MTALHFAAPFTERTACGTDSPSRTRNCDAVTCARCRRTEIFQRCSIWAEYHGDQADTPTEPA